MRSLRQEKTKSVYIWYDNYPEHVPDEYKERVSRVVDESRLGQASLNLSNIIYSDRGWYGCRVVFLDPSHYDNTTTTSWFILDVHGEWRGVDPSQNLSVALLWKCSSWMCMYEKFHSTSACLRDRQLQ